MSTRNRDLFNAVCQHGGKFMVDLMAASKRKDPSYQQVSGYIPKGLALKFKGFCTMQELEISEVLALLIDSWVSEQESKVAERGSDRT